MTKSMLEKSRAGGGGGALTNEPFPSDQRSLKAKFLQAIFLQGDYDQVKMFVKKGKQKIKINNDRQDTHI